MFKKILLIFFSLFLISSCVKKRDLSTNTVVAHILSQPDGLHPYNNNSVMRSYIFSYTQKTLLGLDLKSLDYVPDLIKELPSSSEDNKTFYFELRDDIKWDNGEQLTGEDVVFSAKIMLCHLTNNSQIRPIYNSVIKSVNLDPNNPLKFSMTAQDINWTAKTILGGIYIQQKSYWDPEGLLDNITFDQILKRSFKETEEISDWFNEFNHADNGYKPENLKGLGPYYVSEWEPSQYVTIKRKEAIFDFQYSITYCIFSKHQMVKKQYFIKLLNLKSYMINIHNNSTWNQTLFDFCLVILGVLRFLK